MRLSHDQKEQALAGIRLLGTKKSGAAAANITIEKINAEIKKSAIFKKRVNEALQTGKGDLGDGGLMLVADYAFGRCTECHGLGNIEGEKCLECDSTGKLVKTDRNRLTAAIALSNAFIPGFRGATTVQGKIDHDIIIKPWLPRSENPKVTIDKPDKKRLRAGKKRIYDDKGEYIGVQTVEEVIEGEVIKETNGD